MSKGYADPLDHMSPEFWAVELHYMAGAAFDDLTHAVTGIGHDGQLFHPTPKYISDAFGLLASGLQFNHDELADNEAAFLSALESEVEQRMGLLQAALDKLAEDLGFTPEPPVVIETFPLRGCE